MKSLKFLITLAIITSLIVPTLLLGNSDNKKLKTIVLNKDNAVVLDDEVNPLTVAKVQQKVQELDSSYSTKPIYLVLETPGGSIQAGLDLISNLQASHRPIHTITFFSASMGFQIVQGLGTRYILKHGTLMAHKAKGAFYGEFPGQLDNRYQYYIKRLNELDRVTVSRSCGYFKSVIEFQNKYENEWWIDGFEAVNVGMADEVVAIKCDKTLNTIRTESIDYYGTYIEVQFSNCPAIRGPIGFKVIRNQNNLPEQLINAKIEEIKNRNKIFREKAINY